MSAFNNRCTLETLNSFFNGIVQDSTSSVTVIMLTKVKEGLYPGGLLTGIVTQNRHAMFNN